MEIIIRKYHDWELQLKEWDGKAKMIDHQRLSSIHAFKKTEKNLAIMDKYNNIHFRIKELENEQYTLFKELEEEIR